MGIFVGVILERYWSTDDEPAIPPRHRAPALAERFAPILRFAGRSSPFVGERFVPIDRTHYVEASDLWQRSFMGRRRPHRVRPHEDELSETKPTIALLPTGRPECKAGYDDCTYYLRVRGVKVAHGPVRYQRIQKALIENGARYTVYWHFHRYPDRGMAAIQYWFFYVFNDFGDWHESDFEQITIRLAEHGDPPHARYVPLEAGYSEHERGQRKLWPALQANRDRIGDHPVVFVARGSHANYFGTRSSKVPGCPKIVRPILCVDRPNGKGRALAPGDYALTQLGGSAYGGDYGSGNWIRRGRTPFEEVAVTDPRTRPVWRDPLAWLEKKTDPAR